MKIRLEGTAEEIESFFLENKELKEKIKSISKFYVNNREKNSFFPTSRAVGRVYVEI